MKKTALALTILILALLFSIAELVRMAAANPYWWYTHVDPVLGTIPPSILIYNPLNYTSYSANSLTVNVLVKDAELAGWGCNIEWVGYYLDGRSVELYTTWQRVAPGEEVHPIYIPSEFNFSLSPLALGKHVLTVSAYVAVLGSSGDRPAVFFLDCNSTVFFSVGTTDYSPAPTSTPIPTITPTPEPSTIPAVMLNLESFLTLGIASVIVIAVVGIGLFVYFKKRK